MISIIQTAAFANWLAAIRDQTALAKIVRRVQRLASGNFGDVRSVGSGLHELRIDEGPGYRVYFVNRGGNIIILLGGGDKRTQQSDIAAERALASDKE